MDVVLGVFAFVGHAIEAVLLYIERHHWIFGLARAPQYSSARRFLISSIFFSISSNLACTARSCR